MSCALPSLLVLFYSIKMKWMSSILADKSRRNATYMQVSEEMQRPFWYKSAFSLLVLLPPHPPLHSKGKGTYSTRHISAYGTVLLFDLPLKFHLSSTCLCSSRKNNPAIERYLTIWKFNNISEFKYHEKVA